MEGQAGEGVEVMVVGAMVVAAVLVWVEVTGCREAAGRSRKKCRGMEAVEEEAERAEEGRAARAEVAGSGGSEAEREWVVG